MISGIKVKIRPLKIEDVFKMRDWGYHDNPLLSDYNFPRMTDSEIKVWYRYKALRWSNKYYSIYNEDDKLIGYMGIKGIKKMKRESTLGIVFDPNYINKGYGTDTLTTFLNYYFNEKKMKRMYLEVAEFNKRAYRLYEKMGFVQAGYYLDLFHNQELDLENEYYVNEKSSFVINKKKIYNYIYKMKLEREDFINRKV